MTNPYAVLGVEVTATDAEIKTAYRNLAKKHHPDRFSDPKQKKLAEEKMSEINCAYDQIMESRKNGGAYSGDSGFSSSYSTSGSSFMDIRRLVFENRVSDADTLLSGIPLSERTAEWYYLKGMVFMKRGWSEQAFSYFSQAYEREPSNSEYANAYFRMKNARSGANGGYDTSGSGMCMSPSCSDICCLLMCADCFCDCLPRC